MTPPSPAGEFAGFSDEAFDFLRELGEQTKTWLDANRSTYEREVVGPAKAFVAAMGERLAAEISADIIALPKTNGSIAPINNDLRFSPDKNPYKDHLMFRFWEGANKKTAPTLFVRLAIDDVGFATGLNFASLDVWREKVADDKTGAPLAQALAALSKGRDLEVAGEGLKRVPKPYPEDHPRADLLRHKGFQARWLKPLPKSVDSPKFVDWCTKQLSATTDVHRWLVAELGN